MPVRNVLALAIGAAIAATTLAASPSYATGHRPSSGIAQPRVETVRQEESFFAAVVLSPSDLPAGMSLNRQSYLAVSDVAANAGDAAAANLSADGYVQGYEQVFRGRGGSAVLNGAPAGIGDVVSVFGDAGGASAWNSYESQNAVGVGEQAAAAQGVSVTITDSAPLDVSGLGDEAAGTEMYGSTTIGGLPVNVVLDVAFIRRDRVQFTVAVAGLKGQSPTLYSLAQLLDGRVAAALGLLDGP